jgi:hypothetical protein
VLVVVQPIRSYAVGIKALRRLVLVPLIVTAFRCHHDDTKPNPQNANGVSAAPRSASTTTTTAVHEVPKTPQVAQGSQATDGRPSTASPEDPCASDPRWASDQPLPELTVGDAIGVVLPDSAADATLCPYGDGAPGRPDGYWTPTLADLEPLEAKIEKVLRSEIAKHALSTRLWASANYRRQYLGVVRSGHRIIHVNILPKSFNRRDWHRHVIRISDGGVNYATVEFDTESKSFVFVLFNTES